MVLFDAETEEGPPDEGGFDVRLMVSSSGGLFDANARAYTARCDARWGRYFRLLAGLVGLSGQASGGCFGGGVADPSLKCPFLPFPSLSCAALVDQECGLESQLALRMVSSNETLHGAAQSSVIR